MNPLRPFPIFFASFIRWGTWLVVAATLLGGGVNAQNAQTCGSPGSRFQSPTTVDGWRLELKKLDLSSHRAKQLVPAMIGLVRSPKTEPVLRQQAAMTLGRIGNPARDAIPVLIQIARTETNEEEFNRQWALKALGLFKAVASEAVPEFAGQLENPEHHIDDRILLADVFGRIGSAAAIRSLAKALSTETRFATTSSRPTKSPDRARLRAAIVDSLAYSGTASLGALPTLIRSLDDIDSEVRRKTCQAIGRLGPRAESAVDLLTERLILDEVQAVQDAAAEGLSQLGTASVPNLVRILRSGNVDLAWRAAKALGDIKPLAKEAVGDLTVLTCAKSNRLRIESIRSVWKIVGDDKQVGQFLIRELRVNDRQHQAEATRMLVQLAELQGSVEKALQQLTMDTDSNVARAARQVLKKRALLGK